MKSIISFKAVFIIIVVFFFSSQLFSQKTDFNFNLYTGFFSYRGNGSASTAMIAGGFYVVPSQTSNIYGQQSAFSFCTEIQINRKAKNNFLFGAGLSYERLASRVKINQVGFSGNPAYLLYDANGSSKLVTDYITLNPYAGRRFVIDKTSFDVTGGIDLAILISGHEKGSATTTETKTLYTTNNYYSMIPVDFRTRLQVKAGYKKWGILLAFSLGLTDYRHTENTKVFSTFVRTGVSYTIK